MEFEDKHKTGGGLVRQRVFLSRFLSRRYYFFYAAGGVSE